MALINASSITHSAIVETAFGTTPTATGTRLEVPLPVDGLAFTPTTTELVSPTKRPNGQSNGFRQGMRMVDGSWDLRFVRNGLTDLLLESALRGAFTTNVLKVGSTDKSFSVVSRFDSDQWATARGCIVTGFTFNAKANDEVSCSYDIMGLDWTDTATDASSAISITASTGTEFIGSELATITVGGTSYNCLDLSLEYKIDRPRRPVLTSNTPLAPGSAMVDITAKFKIYREAITSRTNFTGADQAVSFDIGGVGTGYRFQLPRAQASIPSDSLSDGSAFVEVTMKAAYDNTAASALVVTRL